MQVAVLTRVTTEEMLKKHGHPQGYGQSRTKRTASPRYSRLPIGATRLAQTGSLLSRPVGKRGTARIRIKWLLLLTVFLLAGSCLLPSAGAACQQMYIGASYISSWDSYGIQNFYRLEESRYPDRVAGKGPYPDRYGGDGKLMVAYNVLSFNVPPLFGTGTVSSVELRLQVRYLTSFRGSEIYHCGPVTDPRVKLSMHRRLGGTFTDDPETDTTYGLNAMSVAAPSATIPMTTAFLKMLTNAAGTTLLVQGSVATLDNDPFNPQYLYVDGATLVLTITNSGAPIIASQPGSTSVNAGGEAGFSVTACGELPLSYQWKFNGANLPGATSSSLLLSNVSTAQAGNYTVEVGNSSGSVTSAVAVLHVAQSAPFWAFDLFDQTIDAGYPNYHLRGLAGGAPFPSYQWRFEGVDLPGATNNVLWFQGLVTPDLAGRYTLVASNSSGSITSSPALLTVVPFYLHDPVDQIVLLENQGSLFASWSGHVAPTNWTWYHNGVQVPGVTNQFLNFIGTPDTGGAYVVVGVNQFGSVTSRVVTVTIVRQAPQFYSTLYDQTLVAGQENYVFAGASAGPPATYYWYHAGVLIPGARTAFLTFSNTLPSDAGVYSVIASNEVGQATNGPMTISIVPARVSVNPSYRDAGEGATVIFNAAYQGVPQVSFQWFYHKGTLADLTNQPPGGWIALAGETHSSLLLLGVSTNQAGLYAVAVTNIFGGLVSDPAVLVVHYTSAVVFGLDPTVTKHAGDFVWLTGYFDGAPRPSCQWQFNGVDIPGATNYILALSNISTQQAGAYSVTVSNGSGVGFPSSSSTFLSVAVSGPLDDWTSLNPKPQPNPLQAVAYGNGRRVAVGENGAIVVSTDNQTWTATHLGHGIHLHAVAFGNGTFVAAGHADSANFDMPVILTSSDGAAWTAHDLSVSGRLVGVTFGNGHFVVVGARLQNAPFDYEATPVVLISSDGLAWERHYLPGTMFYAPLSAVAFGNGLFVAVSDLAPPSIPSIFYSPDGVNWAVANANTNRDFEAIVAADGAFLAVGDGGMVANSPDGTNWTVRSSNSLVPFKAASYGNGVYVAGGSAGAILMSSDALTWQPLAVPSRHDISGLNFDGHQFTGVGDGGRILVSSNGQIWVDQCVGPDSDLYAIAEGPSAFMAVGDGAILRSTDGANWSFFDLSLKLHGITYGNGLFVAVGKKGAIFTSTDGFLWVPRSVSSTGYVERVIWGGGQFVAVGEGGLLVTSPDGISWTKQSISTPADLEDVAYGNGIYVVVGGYFSFSGAVATVLTSSDGVHWVDQPSVNYFGVRARGVTFGNEKFVLVGNDGLTAVSTDGQYWSDHFVKNENLRAVIYASGYFIASGNDGLLVSSLNGSEWTVNRSPASMNLRGLTATPEGILVVGSNGAIWKSGQLQPLIRGRLLPEGFELRLSGGLDPECRLQTSTDLQHWSDLFIYTNTSPASFLDPMPQTTPARYYRTIPR